MPLFFAFSDLFPWFDQHFLPIDHLPMPIRMICNQKTWLIPFTTTKLFSPFLMPLLLDVAHDLFNFNPVDFRKIQAQIIGS